MDPLVFVRKVDNERAWYLSKKTGLPFGVVRALLLRGWSYEERADSIPVWLAPISVLKKQ